MKVLPIILLAVLMTLTGCTEKIPIAADFSGGNDWAPTVLLQANNYGRISLEWHDTPAPSAVHRNIMQLILEARSGAGPYLPLDTIHAFRGIAGGYESAAFFTAQQQYEVRVRIDYRENVTRYSNEISFASPAVPGTVLKNFALAPPPPYGNFFPAGITFDGGRIYALLAKTLFAIDTLDGRQLNLGMAYSSEDRFYEADFRGIAVHGDTLTLPIFPLQSTNTAVIRRQLISSGQLLSEVALEAPVDEVVGQLVAFSPATTLFFWREHGDDGIFFAEYDSRDGQQLWASPAGNFQQIGWARHFTTVDGRVYGSFDGYYDSRILEISPQSLQVMSDNSNPFFGGNTLTHDGRYFWTISSHTSELAKIKLSDM